MPDTDRAVRGGWSDAFGRGAFFALEPDDTGRHHLREAAAANGKPTHDALDLSLA